MVNIEIDEKDTKYDGLLKPHEAHRGFVDHPLEAYDRLMVCQNCRGIIILPIKVANTLGGINPLVWASVDRHIKCCAKPNYWYSNIIELEFNEDWIHNEPELESSPYLDSLSNDPYKSQAQKGIEG